MDHNEPTDEKPDGGNQGWHLEITDAGNRMSGSTATCVTCAKSDQNSTD